MKRKKLLQKFVAVFLTVVFLFQPLFGLGVLAEGEASSEAVASEEQTTTVTNENQANVENDISATANTGDNEVKTPAEPISTPAEGTGVPEESLGSNNNEPTPTPSQTPETPQIPETLETTEEITSTPTPSISPTPPDSVVAENQETPPNSENTATASAEEKVEVTSDNQAEIENLVTATSSSGQNETSGEDTKTETGDSTVSADLANVVNFNVIGEDFWTEVFNLLGINNGDLDFSQIDFEQKFQEAIIQVLAQNQLTGESSTNIATADFLKSLIISNNNIATVSNILDLSAISGQNSAVGGPPAGGGEIYTGSASIYANLFNLINTNLIGTNFWFGIFNIFGELNGDIILPYELQFLEGLEGTDGTQIEAINENTGENSQNEANASSQDVITVQNTNEAEVVNTVDVLADSGTNEAVVDGSAEIKTGNATAKVDIRNFVNTNIFGNRFVFLLINVFGKWQGVILNWWGSILEDGQTTVAVGRLPGSSSADGQSLVEATNQNTSENSQNTANASSTTSFEVTNNNQAFLTNEIKAQAISGQNEVLGNSAKILTGNSSVVANIANFVNTNIIGHNFFFGIINIFGKFCGNILFPRPDLEITKSVDKETATPGETLTYTISYKNIGRLWAKDVEIVDYLPAGVAFISASDGGVFEGGKIVWKLGKISSGEGGSLSIQIKINDDVSEGALLVNQVGVSTTTDEPNKDNNQAGALTTVSITPPTPTPTGAPGVGGPPAGEGGVGGQAGAAGPPTGGCVPPEAPAAPTLLSAESISSTEVKLTWAPVDRASYYLVAYGLESGNYIYGSPNVGDVTSYIVGSLTPGLTYYFVVAAVADGGCPAPGPYSNELSSTPGMAGEILGVGEVWAAPKEGEIGEGVSVEAPGEVAGAAAPLCPWWWIVLVGEALILGGFYGLILRKAKSPRFWWLTAPTLVILAFLGDKLAHNWWIPNQYCKYVPLGGLIVGGVESAAFKILKKKGGKK